VPSLVSLVITFFDSSSGTVGLGHPYQSVFCFNCLTDSFVSGQSEADSKMPGGEFSSMLPFSYVLKQFISGVLSNSSCPRYLRAELYCMASVAAHSVVTFHCGSPYFPYQIYSWTNFLEISMG